MLSDWRIKITKTSIVIIYLLFSNSNAQFYSSPPAPLLVKLQLLHYNLDTETQKSYLEE